MVDSVKIKPYWGPVGGWGSARSVSEILLRERVPIAGPLTLLHQNKPSGFECVSCSYAKPGDPHPLEFCENGAKATAWEITSKRCGPEFFAAHTMTELESWPVVDLIGEAGDGIERLVRGFRATRYDVPPGSCAGYYPECNPLLPLWHHAERSHVPAAKSIPVRIRHCGIT